MRSIITIAVRELRRIVERKTLYSLIIFLPVFLFLFIGYIYKNELIRELPIAVVDLDHSSLSIMVTKYLDASSSMKISKHCNSINELKEEFRNGSIQGAFVIPENMEKDIKYGKQVSLTAFQNSSNLIIGNYLLNDGTKIVKTISAGILLKKLKSKSLMNDQALNIINPIKIDSQILYNPNYSYEFYLTPGLILLLFQMIIMTSAVLVISSEINHNTFKTLLKLSSGRIYPVIIGKALPHLFFHFCTIFFIYGIVFPIFNISFAGNLLLSIVWTILFAIVSFMMGFAISVIFKDQQTATEASMLINTPAFIFSGFTFPLWSMPEVHNIFSLIIPFTHFLSGFIKLTIMNAPIKYIYSELLILALFFSSSVIISYILLKVYSRKFFK